MTELVHALLALALVLTVVSLLVPVAERLRLPHTVLLAAAGVGLGLLGNMMAQGPGPDGPLGDAFKGLSRLEVGSKLFLPLFLPPLLFTAGLTIDVRRLVDEISAVLLLAIVAVLVCIAGVAGALHWATGFDLWMCLLLGAIVSTTDPAAVIGIFRDVGAPKRLSILAEGESLFNDAVAIAAFAFVVDILASGGEPAAGTLVLHAVRDFLGGMAFGFVMARAAMVVLPRLADSEVAIASVTVSLAYLSYVLADRYLDISGVISVVAAALTVAAYGPTHLHPRQWTALSQTWRQLEFWSNCLIFVLASMISANLLGHIGWLHLLGLGAIVVGAVLARAAVVFGLLPLLEGGRLVQPVDRRYKAILVWGGLRGAVTIVLALVVARDPRLDGAMRDMVAVLATSFVLFTLFVNATTLGLAMRLFGLDKLSRLEIALRDRVLALSKVNVDQQLQQIIRERNVRVEGIDADPISAGAIEAAPPPSKLALDFDERVTVGLRTLCAQERQLYLEHFEQQTLSRRMVARLMARADRLVDAVRDSGVEGYRQTVRDLMQPDLTFRVGLWLLRQFGYDRVLTQRLADRIEVLMIQQDVLAELTTFNIHSIADLLGGDAEERLAEIIGERRELVANSLQALALQYPGYAESIRDRQLERAAIRFESMEYTRRLGESIISREIYADLRRQLNARREALARRPLLDLGLELAGMIARVPLLAALDASAMREIAKRLGARFVLPGQRIVARGGPSDAMYFIAAGEVVVQSTGGPVVLGEGDFFGEMGLLGGQRRNADVVAKGYCHLLVLQRRDFVRLLDRRPEIRRQIEAVAARREADTPQA